MNPPDNFKFAVIPAPSTPDEARIVELVRLVVREENLRREEMFMDALSEALRTFRSIRNPRGAA